MLYIGGGHKEYFFSAGEGGLGGRTTRRVRSILRRDHTIRDFNSKHFTLINGV